MLDISSITPLKLDRLTQEVDSMIVHNNMPPISVPESHILSQDKIMNLGTWQQILQTQIDMLLVLEHSFYLFHNNVSQPVQSAAEKYTASNIPKQVKLAMKEVFKQYAKASEEEKVEMLLNVILEHRMTIS